MPQAPVRPRKQRVRTEARRAMVATWETAVMGFIADGRRRNLAPATMETYESILTNARTTAFRQDHGITDPEGMTAEQLREFETELIAAGLTPRSVIGYHRVLKTFAAHCIKQGLGVDRQILSVDGPKQAQMEPEVFSVDEEKRLVAAARTERDKLLIEFMMRTGLRLQEMEQLTVDDIITTPNGSYVRVRQGKGKKDRAVPLDTERTKLSARLHRYITKVRPRDAGTDALFLSERRDTYGQWKPLSARGIQVLLYRLGDETKIHVHPHKFRHTFATRALSAGVDVMALQRALGHTTLAMVSRYVHYQKDDLLNAWQRRRD